MIVTKTVLMGFDNKHAQHYRDKGYDYTKQNCPCEIKVSDLIPESHARVMVCCEICHAERELPYYLALRLLPTGNRCHSCAIRSCADSRRATRISKTGSFLDACIDRYGTEFMAKYWSGKNTVDPSMLCRTSRVKVWIKCQKTDYHDDYQVMTSDFLRGDGCNQCRIGRHPLDSFGGMLDREFGEGYALSIWSMRNNATPYDYTPQSNAKVWLMCAEGVHEDYEQQVSVASNSHGRCPKCTRERHKSMFQDKVETYIFEKYGLEMRFENACSLNPINPWSGFPLRYDIELVGMNILIEVQGEQHYHPTSYDFNHSPSNKRTPEEELQYQQAKDDVKRRFAINHGYTFLEIPYTTEKSGGYKHLIDSAISSVTSKLSEVAG